MNTKITIISVIGIIIVAVVLGVIFTNSDSSINTVTSGVNLYSGPIDTYNECVSNHGEIKLLSLEEEDNVCKLIDYYYYPITSEAVKNKIVYADGVIDTFIECLFEVSGIAPGHNRGALLGAGIGNRTCSYGDYTYQESTNEAVYNPESSMVVKPDPITDEDYAAAILNQICPADILGERDNLYDGSRDYTLNTCTYDKDPIQLSDSYYFGEQASCAANIEDEINKRSYNILNGCLYKDWVLVFEKTIHSLVALNEFGEEVNIGESADEWFRFEDNDKLYVYFRGAAGCGGCVFASPYMVIDLKTGDIVKGSDENVPYPPNVEFSPSGMLGAELESTLSADQQLGNIYVYDFVNNTKSDSVYEIEDLSGYRICGDGCYLANGVIEWVDEGTISLQKFQLDEDNSYNLKSVINDDNVREYFPDGEPIVIDIN